MELVYPLGKAQNQVCLIALSVFRANIVSHMGHSRSVHMPLFGFRCCFVQLPLWSSGLNGCIESIYLFLYLSVFESMPKLSPQFFFFFFFFCVNVLSVLFSIVYVVWQGLGYPEPQGQKPQAYYLPLMKLVCNLYFFSLCHFSSSPPPFSCMS